MCANEDMLSHYYITITSPLHHIATPTQDSDTDGKYTLNKDTFVQAQKKQRKQTSRYTKQTSRYTKQTSRYTKQTSRYTTHI